MKQKHMTNFLRKDDVLTLLIHLGYLAYNETTRTVFIPNEEVREEFLRVIRTSGWNEVIRAISHSERLLAETLQQNEQTVAQELLVGINYDKKEKKHQCIIETFNIS